MADAGDEVEQLLLQGPRSLYFLSTLLDTNELTASEFLPAERFGCHPIELCGYQVLAFRISETGEDGYLFVTQQGEAPPLLHKLLEAGKPFGIAQVSDDALNVLRIEAGIPRVGIDMDASNRMPETTLERDAVSYDKGCYLGQEVIAKLRAYSSVKQALVGLILESGVFPQTNSTLRSDGQDIGVLKSSVFSPTLDRTIAIAYFDRDWRTPGTLLELSGRTQPNSNAIEKSFTASVVVLPFCAAPAREERARALYEEALQRFERDEHDQDDTAIELLREAVLLFPTFEDAYEALGVILNRHHRVDEAIHYMQILARLNPDSVLCRQRHDS